MHQKEANHSKLAKNFYKESILILLNHILHHLIHQNASIILLHRPLYKERILIMYCGAGVFCLKY